VFISRTSFSFYNIIVKRKRRQIEQRNLKKLLISIIKFLSFSSLYHIFLFLSTIGETAKAYFSHNYGKRE